MRGVIIVIKTDNGNKPLAGSWQTHLDGADRMTIKAASEGSFANPHWLAAAGILRHRIVVCVNIQPWDGCRLGSHGLVGSHWRQRAI